MSLTKLTNLDAIQSLSQDEIQGLLPSVISTRVDAIPPQIYEMTLEQLEKKIAVDGEVPVDLSRSRIAFWLEFERSYRTGMGFNLQAVYGGIMNAKRFNRDVLGNSYILAYTICPPPTYSIVMDEMLHFGLQFQRDLLKLPHTFISESGKKMLDHKLLALKNSIINGVHDRIKGLPVAKSINVHKSVGSGGEDLANRPSPLEIDERIRELENSPKEVKPLRRNEE